MERLGLQIDTVEEEGTAGGEEDKRKITGAQLYLVNLDCFCNCMYVCMYVYLCMICFYVCIYVCM